MSDRSLVGDDPATWEQLLDAWRPLPAVIVDRRLNVLAATDVAQRLSGAFQVGANLARFTFLVCGPIRVRFDLSPVVLRGTDVGSRAALDRLATIINTP